MYSYTTFVYVYIKYTNIYDITTYATIKTTMNKAYNHMVSSITGRLTLFLAAFVTAAVLAALVYQLTASTSVLFGVLVIIMLPVVGIVFISTPNLLSRVVSASVLFVLAVISLRVGHSLIPDAYLFAAAFAFSAAGSLAQFHRKQSSFKKAILYSCLIALGTLLITAVFVYGVIILHRFSVN